MYRLKAYHRWDSEEVRALTTIPKKKPYLSLKSSEITEYIALKQVEEITTRIVFYIGGNSYIPYEEYGTADWFDFEKTYTGLMGGVTTKNTEVQFSAIDVGFSFPSREYASGVLAKNGKIYGMPRSNTILEFDPVTQTSTKFGTVSSTCYSGVLAEDGEIYALSTSHPKFLKINVNEKVISEHSIDVGGSSDYYKTTVLSPTGKIYGIPSSASQVIEIDPSSGVTSPFGAVGGGYNKWLGGILAPNGNIYCVPYSDTMFLVIDTLNKTVRKFGQSNMTGVGKYGVGVLAHNGKMYVGKGGYGSFLEVDLEKETWVGIGSASEEYHESGGILASNGKIYMVSNYSGKIVEIDVDTKTILEYNSVTGGIYPIVGLVNATDGNIYGVPHMNNKVLKINVNCEPIDVLNSPFLNKM